MRILFLTQIIPYPPDAGPKVKTWHVLRYLIEKGHEVHLATFIRPEEKPFLPVVQELCSQVSTIDIHRSRLYDIYYWLRSHLSGRPFLIERDDIPEMRHLVNQLLLENKYDAFHADQLTMCQFAFPTKPGDTYWKGRAQLPVLIFDAHNAVWTIVERMRQTTNLFLKPIAALETKRLKRYEGQIVRHFDHTLAVTEQDRQALLQAIPDSTEKTEKSITVIPIAVDTQKLSPVQRIAGSHNILTLGTLHYPPNADGIRWFAREVFPLIRSKIPDATLTIIGKNPPKDLLRLAFQNPQSIQVTGYVPDLNPYLEKAGVMVIPVRAGGGMRVRILEALSLSMPVVTTTIGLEGIEATPGRDVLVEDTSPKFAEAAIRVLQDRSLQEQLGENGRSCVEEKYDWQVVLMKLDEVYDQLSS